MYLVTGGTGFIGRAVVERLVQLNGFESVRGSVRSVGQAVFNGVTVDAVGEITGSTCWKGLLDGVQVVVHCAGGVGVMGQGKIARDLDLMTTNYEGTVALAKQAAEAGVRRLVYISSIKVNGEETHCGKKFMADDLVAPKDTYGLSKYLAEEQLLRISRLTGLEVVILRPPLVYGNGVRGNFALLMSLVNRGFPLPFKSVDNLRSFVALDNLVDCIMQCCHHPRAAGERFLVADNDDTSTPHLLKILADSLGKRSMLFPMSPGILRWGGRMLCGARFTSRICGSLQVDIEKTTSFIDWRPQISLVEGVRRTVQWWQRGSSAS